MFICSCANADLYSDFEDTNNDSDGAENNSSETFIVEDTDLGSIEKTEKASLEIKGSSSNHYGILIEEQSLQIKKLRAELDFINEELYKLKAQSQVWENPFSIYNKEISLDNGSTIYGKIIYQDEQIIDTIHAGNTLSIPITVTSNTAHSLPSGTSFNRQVWLELIVTNNNNIIFESGKVINNEQLNFNDSDLLLFRSIIKDDDGGTDTLVQTILVNNVNPKIIIEKLPKTGQ